MKLSLFTVLILFSFNLANAADLEAALCPKDSKVLRVEIKGESAINLFRGHAMRLGRTPAELMNIESGGMRCMGLKFSSDGDVTEALCSFVNKGGKSIPFPQIDPGFSREEIIVCD